MRTFAIVVIGGFLKTSAKTSEYWEDVADNISSTISREDGERCLNILSLSYDQLPIHLKPCFMYLATYPYDYKICVSELIRLWVADGFLRPNVSDVTLEEVALKHFTELGNRNLIIIKKLNFKGEMKHFTVHDLVMELCVRVARKERFLYVDYGDEEFQETIESQRRRLVFHGTNYNSIQQKGFSRSYISFSELEPSYISRLRLLRSCILRVDGRKYLKQLVNLRLLEFSVERDFLRWFQKISLLCNLETFVVSGFDTWSKLPPEIWKLRNIKHLIFPHLVTLPNPPISGTSADFAFQNLQTLEWVQILSDKVLDMIPNIKKLRILYNHQNDADLLHGFVNLAHCQKLEILDISLRGCMDLKSIKFAHSLRKLTLSTGFIPWEKCGVGLLPNLEVLKLHQSKFDYNKWNTVEGEFPKLKTLSLERCDLESWTVEKCCHFPSLERLHIIDEQYLEEIPEVFGESMTLKSIKLLGCLHTAVISAKQILDEQHSQGNYELTVYAHQFYAPGYMEEMRVDLMSMKTDNFHATI